MKRLQAKKDREYRLMPLTPTEAAVRKPRLIFINGFLQEDVDKADDWLAAVDARFAGNGMFHWQWPAGSLDRYLKKLQDLPVSESWLFEKAGNALENVNKSMPAFAEKFFNRIKKRIDGYKKYINIIKFSLILILPMAAVLSFKGNDAHENDEISPDLERRKDDKPVWTARNIVPWFVGVGGMFVVSLAVVNFLKTWHEAREHAEEAGVKLADQLVRRAEERQETFILMGHSLGARVARACVHELHRRNRSHIVQDVYLLSGAVASGPWEDVAGSISGRIYNFYAPGDLVVGPLYKASGCWEETIGIAEIPDTGTSNVENHNVTDILEKCQGEGTPKFIHMRYKRAFGTMLADCVP